MSLFSTASSNSLKNRRSLDVSEVRKNPNEDPSSRLGGGGGGDGPLENLNSPSSNTDWHGRVLERRKKILQQLRSSSASRDCAVPSMTMGGGIRPSADILVGRGDSFSSSNSSGSRGGEALFSSSFGKDPVLQLQGMKRSPLNARRSSSVMAVAKHLTPPGSGSGLARPAVLAPIVGLPSAAPLRAPPLSPLGGSGGITSVDPLARTDAKTDELLARVGEADVALANAARELAHLRAEVEGASATASTTANSTTLATQSSQLVHAPTSGAPVENDEDSDLMRRINELKRRQQVAQSTPSPSTSTSTAPATALASAPAISSGAHRRIGAGRSATACTDNMHSLIRQELMKMKMSLGTDESNDESSKKTEVNNDVGASNSIASKPGSASSASVQNTPAVRLDEDSMLTEEVTTPNNQQQHNRVSTTTITTTTTTTSSRSNDEPLSCDSRPATTASSASATSASSSSSAALRRPPLPSTPSSSSGNRPMTSSMARPMTSSGSLLRDLMSDYRPVTAAPRPTSDSLRSQQAQKLFATLSRLRALPPPPEPTSSSASVSFTSSSATTTASCWPPSLLRLYGRLSTIVAQASWPGLVDVFYEGLWWEYNEMPAIEFCCTHNNVLCILLTTFEPEHVCWLVWFFLYRRLSALRDDLKANKDEISVSRVQFVEGVQRTLFNDDFVAEMMDNLIDVRLRRRVELLVGNLSALTVQRAHLPKEEYERKCNATWDAANLKGPSNRNSASDSTTLDSDRQVWAWSPLAVSRWLCYNDCPEFSPVFEKLELDGVALLSLTRTDVDELVGRLGASRFATPSVGGSAGGRQLSTTYDILTLRSGSQTDELDGESQENVSMTCWSASTPVTTNPNPSASVRASNFNISGGGVTRFSARNVLEMNDETEVPSSSSGSSSQQLDFFVNYFPKSTASLENSTSDRKTSPNCHQHDIALLCYCGETGKALAESVQSSLNGRQPLIECRLVDLQNTTKTTLLSTTIPQLMKTAEIGDHLANVILWFVGELSGSAASAIVGARSQRNAWRIPLLGFDGPGEGEWLFWDDLYEALQQAVTKGSSDGGVHVAIIADLFPLPHPYLTTKQTETILGQFIPNQSDLLESSSIQLFSATTNPKALSASIDGAASAVNLVSQTLARHMSGNADSLPFHEIVRRVFVDKAVLDLCSVRSIHLHGAGEVVLQGSPN